MKNKTSCLDCFNENCFIKKYCSISLMNEMDTMKIINRYSKKQMVFHEGSATDGIYFIQTGKIKVFKKGAFNKNQIVRISSEGDFLGHRGFSSTNTYPVSAEAITTSSICFVSKKFFYKILEDTPKFTINLMLFLADELNYEESRLRDMAVFNVREKVAKALLILVDKLGTNSLHEINNIEDLSRQDIAELVGLNSNQVTKVLAEFKEDKVLEIEGKKIKVLQQKKLEDIVSI
ncbi:MAG: Crp/Fnr family transcriptional regulator [Bacteroidetes bacterium]|nr:Crp/Fnr family transcriptional regulator [Bacteroidota bacterium]